MKKDSLTGVWLVLFAIVAAQSGFICLVAMEKVPASFYPFRIFVPLGIVLAYVLYANGLAGIKKLLKPLLLLSFRSKKDNNKELYTELLVHLELFLKYNLIISVSKYSLQSKEIQ